MTTLTGPMVSDQGRSSIVMFGALEIVLPGYTLRLVDGAGFVTFGGHTFVGRDAVYGVLAGVSEYTDGVDDTAPSLTVTLQQVSNVGMAAIASPAAQESQVSLWVGDVNPATGAVIADPDLAFVGELDVATQLVGQRTRALDIAVASIFERFFDQDEGNKLNNGFHQLSWPGEVGLEYDTQVQRQIPWGSEAPRASLTTMAPQGGGGGLGFDFRQVFPF